MSAPPYMPLYVADYLGDTRHLSTEQHGAYLLLLMAMWRAGGRLPNERAKLARMAGLSPAKWAKMEAEILAFFTPGSDDIGHRRIEKELEKYQEISTIRSEIGSRGAVAKSLKKQQAEEAKASRLLKQNTTNSNSVVVPLDKSNGQVSNPDDAAWDLAKRMLIAQGDLTEKSAGAFFGRLLSANGLEARDLLSSVANAMANGTREPKAYLAKAATQVAKRRHEPPVAKRVAFV